MCTSLPYKKICNLQLFSSSLMLLIKQCQSEVQSFSHHAHQQCAHQRMIQQFCKQLSTATASHSCPTLFSTLLHHPHKAFSLPIELKQHPSQHLADSSSQFIPSTQISFCVNFTPTPTPTLMKTILDCPLCAVLPSH